jgi:hypothetical protein
MRKAALGAAPYPRRIWYRLGREALVSRIIASTQFWKSVGNEKGRRFIGLKRRPHFNASA